MINTFNSYHKIIKLWFRCGDTETQNKAYEFLINHGYTLEECYNFVKPVSAHTINFYEAVCLNYLHFRGFGNVIKPDGSMDIAPLIRVNWLD